MLYILYLVKINYNSHFLTIKITIKMKPWNQNNSNSLLTKDDVGKSKPSTYDLPSSPDYVFGKSTAGLNNEGVRDCNI